MIQKYRAKNILFSGLNHPWPLVSHVFCDGEHVDTRGHSAVSYALGLQVVQQLIQSNESARPTNARTAMYNHRPGLRGTIANSSIRRKKIHESIQTLRNAMIRPANELNVSDDPLRCLRFLDILNSKGAAKQISILE